MLELKQTEFYFIRHGETDWNCEGRCMGQKDIPLSILGMTQARNAANTLKNSSIKVICHSPLQRARKTAELINKVLNCPMIEIDSLKECCWGALEGQLRQDGKHIENWAQGNTPEGGEDYQAFLKRALEGINAALQYPRPLIVSHGGVYWAIQRAIGQLHGTGTAIQNCVTYYHKPVNGMENSWHVEPIEYSVYEDPYEI